MNGSAHEKPDGRPVVASCIAGHNPLNCKQIPVQSTAGPALGSPVGNFGETVTSVTGTLIAPVHIGTRDRSPAILESGSATGGVS